MTIDTLGIVGTGAMGSGIIEVAAKAGVSVVARDISAEAVEAGRARVEGSMGKALERGKLDEATRDAAIASITWTTDLADLAGCLMVFALMRSIAWWISASHTSRPKSATRSRYGRGRVDAT